MKSNIKDFLDDLVNSFKIYEDVVTTLMDDVELDKNPRQKVLYRTNLQNRSEAMFEVLKSLERVGSITKKELTDLTESFEVDIEGISLSDKVEFFGFKLPEEIKKTESPASKISPVKHHIIR